MQDTVSLITPNKILLFLCVVICVMVVIAIFKRFFWLFLTAVCVVLMYAGYLAYNKQEVPTTKDEIIEHGRQKLEDLKKRTEQELLENKGKALGI